MGLTWQGEGSDKRVRAERSQAPQMFALWDMLSAAVSGCDWKRAEEICSKLTPLVSKHAWCHPRGCECPYSIGTMSYARSPAVVQTALGEYNEAVRLALRRDKRPKVT